MLLAVTTEAAKLNFGHKPWPANVARPSLVKTTIPSAAPPPAWHWGDVDGVNYLTQVTWDSRGQPTSLGRGCSFAPEVPNTLR